ncbi:hypothetical protein DXG03_008086 [Asterophora parasitica]|uniref:Uncharacterized protein n=1 Tax=Asterophora parasitica TaxID=117018 RepID=A0A9P7KBJ2_9AGAR|nr:hypothetical protein DXG03_008086 [Asterophora parasitica]
MNDIPYTTPEEDPFNVQPFLQPRRRRSSLLDKWINEQQKKSDHGEHPSTPHINPYLAYPELGHGVPNVSRDDVVTLDNYDLVNDDDIPPQSDSEKQEVPGTPTTSRTRRASKLLNTPSSFRTFNLPFRSSSPASLSVQDPGSPRSMFSFIPRTPRHSTDATIGNTRSSSRQHNRSISLSTLSITGKNPCFSDAPAASPSTAKWRPSVLGHFAASSTSISVPSDTTPSRPSISSGDTYTSGTGTVTTTTDSELPMTPSRMNFMDSIRFRSKSGSVFSSGSGIMSSSSLRSQKLGTSLGNSSVPALSIIGSGPATASTSTLADRNNTVRIPLAPKPASRLANSNLYDGDGDDDEDDDTCQPVAQPTKPLDPTRPHVAYSSTGGTLPRVNLASLSSRHRKKKKLVISGIGSHEARKFEGVKRWCESFGEVSQIVRMPNGDLHVHFRLPEVADTVCRLRAKVYITGVGSVQLSWYTGDKR